MKTITRCKNTKVPNDSDIKKIKAKDQNGDSLEFNTPRMKVPKLKVQRLGEGEQLNDTPCNGVNAVGGRTLGH